MAITRREDGPGFPNCGSGSCRWRLLRGRLQSRVSGISHAVAFYLWSARDEPQNYLGSMLSELAGLCVLCRVSIDSSPRPLPARLLFGPDHPLDGVNPIRIGPP